MLRFTTRLKKDVISDKQATNTYNVTQRWFADLELARENLFGVLSDDDAFDSLEDFLFELSSAYSAYVAAKIRYELQEAKRYALSNLERIVS